MSDERRYTAVLVGCGLAATATYAIIYALGDLRQQLWGFEAAFFVAFTVYLFAAWTVLAWSRQERRQPRAMIWLLLAFALVFRAIMLAAAPTLSDDLYRYVWEGKVLAHGFSPYLHAPYSPDLAFLRDGIWDGINNKGVPSPYPPLAQLQSLVGHWLMPGNLLGPKVIATLADLLIAAMLVVVLVRQRQPPERVIIYAWSPLPLVAFAHSGHNDAAMVLLVLLAAYLLSLQRHTTSALALAAATLAKAVPVLVLPLFALRWGLRPALLYLFVVGAGYLPLLWLGGGATGSLGEYALTWADNDSVYFLLRAAFGLAIDSPAILAKVATAGLLVVGVSILIARRELRDRPIFWQVYVVFGLTLLVSSTVHTWYVTWLLPFLCLCVSAGRLPMTFAPGPSYGWLLFSGLVALPYLTYADWQWQIWISLVEYGPLYALLSLPLLQAGAKRIRAAGPRLGERQVDPGMSR